MRLRSRQFGWKLRLVKLALAGALLTASITPSWALAQSKSEPWAEPLNLSHSGIAKNPVFVIDSQGAAHVLWQDDLGNFIYTRFDGNQWTSPETTDLNRLFRLSIPGEATDPQAAIYTGPNPALIAGPGESSFAFWISPQGRLFTSKANNSKIDQLEAWDSQRLVAREAASFAAAIDARGVLHLAYVRTVSDLLLGPAGIYYVRSKDGGSSWSQPELLYESSYLRRLGQGEANISLATSGTEDAQRVYVAWDNRPRKQVLLAQSADGGDSWGQPVPIAGPAPNTGSDSPFNIHVGTTQDSLVLVWQSGQPDGVCSQLYQSSSDSGATWSHPKLMIEGLVGCAQANAFVTDFADSSEGLSYFLTEAQNQIYLSAWNGDQWSQPQAQPTLAGFEEPEIYTGVDYGCHRGSLLGERLYIVGCDQGGGGDIWVTSLDLTSNSSWFSDPIWSQVAPVTEQSLKMEAIKLVATDDGLIHAFLSQHQDPAIYYTYWDGESWSRISPVLAVPEGEAAWPAIATGPGNALYLIARNDRGSLYLSRAISGSAATASGWSTPVQLAIGHDGEIGSIDVASDAAGTFYVAYSVPVNDGRGIYLVQSKDQGTTWSEPVQVFDGAAAGFDVVGAPSLLISAHGLLHVIWKQQSIAGDGISQQIALYYTRSEDGGHAFDDATPVVKDKVAWRDIAADGKGNLHLLWQLEDSLSTVYDQASLDGGITWQFPEGLPDEGGVAAVTSDPAGRLHLLGVGSGSLGDWLWDGSQWQSDVPISLPWSSQPEGPVEFLAATANSQGKMMVVFTEAAAEGNPGEMTLRYSTRAFGLPEKPALLSPTPNPGTPTPEVSPTPASTVETGLAGFETQTDANQPNKPISPLVMAMVPVALLLLGVLGAVIRQVARSKNP